MVVSRDMAPRPIGLWSRVCTRRKNSRENYHGSHAEQQIAALRRMTSLIHRAASSRSAVLLLAFATAFNTGRLTSTSSFAGFISVAASPGSPCSQASHVTGSKITGMRL